MKPIPEQHQFQWLNWLSQTNIQINKWEKNVSRVEMTHDWTYIFWIWVAIKPVDVVIVVFFSNSFKLIVSIPMDVSVKCLR